MKSVKPHKGKTEVLSICRERAPRGCESVQHDYHAGCYVRDTKECFEPFLQRALEHSLHIIQCNLPGWHFLQHTARETFRFSSRLIHWNLSSVAQAWDMCTWLIPVMWSYCHVRSHFCMVPHSTVAVASFLLHSRKKSFATTLFYNGENWVLKNDVSVPFLNFFFLTGQTETFV